MIITQTPLRVSLFGGGTDFRDFYSKEGGAVLSLGIDKYIYVIVKERFDKKIYINYSKKEIIDTVDEIQHELVREAMRKTGITDGVEVITLADVPSEGSGLGSSSSVTVGLLNAFYAYQGEQVSPERLAREACEIEIDIVGKPIGIQDQYIAAYGNMRFFGFEKNGEVVVEKLELTEGRKRRLVSNLLLFYTNKTRSSSDILHEQKKKIGTKTKELKRIRELAFEAKKHISNGAEDDLGLLLGEGWEVKKRLASNITNGDIDGLYKKALDAGAVGGKISGAGSGGFLLLYCPMEKQDSLRDTLKAYRELPFLLSRDGSKVVFNTRGYEWR